MFSEATTLYGWWLLLLDGSWITTVWNTQETLAWTLPQCIIMLYCNSLMTLKKICIQLLPSECKLYIIYSSKENSKPRKCILACCECSSHFIRKTHHVHKLFEPTVLGLWRFQALELFMAYEVARGHYKYKNQVINRLNSWLLIIWLNHAWYNITGFPLYIYNLPWWAILNIIPYVWLLTKLLDKYMCVKRAHRAFSYCNLQILCEKSTTMVRYADSLHFASTK